MNEADREADEIGSSPGPVMAPNAEIREAIAELEAGKGARFTSVEALMKDLESGD